MREFFDEASAELVRSMQWAKWLPSTQSLFLGDLRALWTDALARGWDAADVYFVTHGAASGRHRLQCFHHIGSPPRFTAEAFGIMHDALPSFMRGRPDIQGPWHLVVEGRPYVRARG